MMSPVEKAQARVSPRRAPPHATPEAAHADALRRARALLRLLEVQLNGAATEVKTWTAAGNLAAVAHHMETAALCAYLVAEDDEDVALARLRADAAEVPA